MPSSASDKLAELEAALARESATLAEEQKRRRAEHVRQLIAKFEEKLYGETVEPIRALIPRAVSPSIECKTAGTETAGKEDKCAGCSRRSNCSSVKQQEEMFARQIAGRMSTVAHKILVMSTKGGVGKSMVSSQLAYALAAQGHKVGLLDVDICGATVPKMTGKRGEAVMQDADGALVPVRVGERLEAMSIGFVVDDENQAVIWRGPRKHGLIRTFLSDVKWGPIDYLVIDTPPGTSDEHLTTVQLLKATGVDGAVLVTTPQDVSVIEVGKQIDFCRRVGIPVLGVVENFSFLACPECSAVTEVWPSSSGGGRGLASSRAVPFLGSVPLDPALSRSGEVGKAADRESATGRVIYSIAEQLNAAMTEQHKADGATATAVPASAPSASSSPSSS